MKYQDGITIIIPVYNADKSLNKCVDSIITQTFDKWKIILIDDGSTDNSSIICDGYANKYENIKVYHIENSGVSNARNIGIKNVETKYFVCVDSDDWVEPVYLQYLMEAKYDYPDVDNIWCCFETDTNGKKKKYLANESEDYSIFDRTQIMNLYELWIAQAPYCKLYNTELVHKNSIKMNTEFSLGEDLMFNLDYLSVANGNKIVIVNKAPYKYILGKSDSLDSKYRPNLKEIYSYLNSYILSYLEAWNVDEKQYDIFNNTVFYSLENVLANEMKKENRISFFKKISNNSKLLRSQEFKNALKKRTCFIHPMVFRIYKSGHYFSLLLFNKIVKIKNKIRG